MPPFTSRELYIMNGGQKLYIYKDGFGDVYQATPEEESLWREEVIATSVVRLDTEINPTGLKFAIDNLVYHKVPELYDLLLHKLETAVGMRRIVFATALWTQFRYEGSFAIVYQELQVNRETLLHDVFWALDRFRDHPLARKFIVACLEGEDIELMAKASVTLTMWAHTGMATLRGGGMLENLIPGNKGSVDFMKAVERLKMILFKPK